jgi:Ca2+-binding RTX toxin-like protein
MKHKRSALSHPMMVQPLEPRRFLSATNSVPIITGISTTDTVTVVSDPKSNSIHVGINGKTTVTFPASVGVDNVIQAINAGRTAPQPQGNLTAVVTVADGIIQVTGTSGNDTIAVALDSKTDTYDVTVNNVRSSFPVAGINGIVIHAMAGNDSIEMGHAPNSTTYVGDTGTNLPATVYGGAGYDHIDSGDAADLIFGGAGNDQIISGDGNDTVDGGAGDDHIDGAGGNDLIRGGAGNDTLFGSIGDDTVQGGAGNDNVQGGLGQNLLEAGRGNNQFQSTGTDTIPGVTDQPGGSMKLSGSNGLVFGGTDVGFEFPVVISAPDVVPVTSG